MVRGSFVHCLDQRVRHRACSGAVHLASSPPPIPYFFSLPLFHQCDVCLEWGLMAGLRGFDSQISTISGALIGFTNVVC